MTSASGFIDRPIKDIDARVIKEQSLAMSAAEVSVTTAALGSTTGRPAVLTPGSEPIRPRSRRCVQHARREVTL